MKKKILDLAAIVTTATAHLALISEEPLFTENQTNSLCHFSLIIKPNQKRIIGIHLVVFKFSKLYKVFIL